MTSMAIVLGVGLVMRFGGAVMKHSEHHLIVRSLGWVGCMLGVWLLASAVGAWSPIWVALAFAVIGIALQLRWNRVYVAIIVDIIAVITLARVSLPPLNTGTTIAAVAAISVTGWVLDRFAAALNARSQRIVLIMECVGVFAVAIIVVQVLPTMPVFAWHRICPTTALHVSIVPTWASERVNLANGVVAWLEEPSGEGPHAAAVVFHGAHRDGAHQPAAKVLRRALLDAGFQVLSVDHPAFGLSAKPHGIDIERWDSLPAVHKAIEIAIDAAEDRPVLAVGHSMGCLEVLRALSHSTEIDAAILFGGAVNVPPICNDAWAVRFHEDRQLKEPLPIEATVGIRDRMYNAETIALALSDDLPPVLFVRFGIEHDDVIQGRDVLAGMLPVEPETWDFQMATHYFNAWRRGGVLVADHRVARQLADRLHVIRVELEAER